MSHYAYNPRRKLTSAGLLAAVPQKPLFLTSPIAFCLGLAFVAFGFTLGDGDFDLGQTLVIEIHHQRHQRHALA